MFLLKSENLDLQLEIVPVSTLIQHEEIIATVSRRLTMEFANLSYLRHPVIVEKNNIVLDGNHRVTVFKKLGFRFIPVCRIDYFNRYVKLRYWFRVLKNVNDPMTLTSLIHEMDGRLVTLPTKEALVDTLATHDFSLGIQQGNRYQCVRFSNRQVADAVTSYQILEKLQNRLIKRNVTLQYVPCESIRGDDECEAVGPEDVIIWTPQIGKDMIVTAARDDRIFAPKTTRHLIPARPLNINIPGNWLKEDVSLEDINKRLLDHLAAKRIRKFGPGQVINGRFYGEKLFVFYD